MNKKLHKMFEKSHNTDKSVVRKNVCVLHFSSSRFVQMSQLIETFFILCVDDSIERD